MPEASKIPRYSGKRTKEVCSMFAAHSGLRSLSFSGTCIDDSTFFRP